MTLGKASGSAWPGGGSRQLVGRSPVEGRSGNILGTVLTQGPQTHTQKEAGPDRNQGFEFQAISWLARHTGLQQGGR